MSKKYRRKGGLHLRVLVDMDGVLCDFEGTFLEKFRQLHPDEPYIPLEDREGFYLDLQYKKLRSDLQELCKEVIEMEGFFRDLVPIEGAIDAVKAMSSIDGVEVFICTSPLTNASHSVKEKFEWVEEHLGRDWIGQMVVTKDKTIVSGDLLIDDKPKIKGVEKYPSWDHVLFTSCNNKHLDIRQLRCTQRLDDWTSSSWVQLIEEYKKKIMSR